MGTKILRYYMGTFPSSEDSPKSERSHGKRTNVSFKFIGPNSPDTSLEITLLCLFGKRNISPLISQKLFNWIIDLRTKRKTNNFYQLLQSFKKEQIKSNLSGGRFSVRPMNVPWTHLVQQSKTKVHAISEVMQFGENKKHAAQVIVVFFDLSARRACLQSIRN